MNTRVGILACYKSSATILWSTINAIWSDSLDCILNCILSIDWNTSQTQNTPIEIHQAANQVHVLQQIVIMLSARDCCQYEWSHSSPILGRGSKRLKLRCNDCKQGHLTAIISPIIMKFIDDNLTNICSVNNMNHFWLPCNLFKFLPHALIMVKKIEVSVAQSTKFMHVSVSRWQLPRIWNDTKHGITMVW